MAKKRGASHVAMDKRLVVYVPAEFAERIAGGARSKMTTLSEFARQALLAALGEATSSSKHSVTAIFCRATALAPSVCR